MRENLARACVTGDTAGVLAAMRSGVDPNLRYRQRTLLNWAAQEGQDAVVATALAGRADPNRGDGDLRVRPLHTAAGEGRIKVVRRLLRAGANPNVRVRGMGAPLHLAGAYGRLQCVKALFQAGANPSLRDEDGMRPIDYARRYGHQEVARFLKTG